MYECRLSKLAAANSVPYQQLTRYFKTDVTQRYWLSQHFWKQLIFPTSCTA